MVVHLPNASLADPAVVGAWGPVHLAARANGPVFFGRGISIGGVYHRAPVGTTAGPIVLAAAPGFLARVGV